jgi:hypothetical protein
MEKLCVVQWYDAEKYTAHNGPEIEKRPRDPRDINAVRAHSRRWFAPTLDSASVVVLIVKQHRSNNRDNREMTDDVNCVDAEREPPPTS